MVRKLLTISLATLFLYMALKESREDILWSLIYLLISLEYGLDLIGVIKIKPKSR